MYMYAKHKVATYVIFVIIWLLQGTLQVNHLETLKEIFHTLPQDDIEKALQQYGFSEAVDHLLVHQGKFHSAYEQPDEQQNVMQDLQLQQNLPDNPNLEVTSLEVATYSYVYASMSILSYLLSKSEVKPMTQVIYPTEQTNHCQSDF